MVKKCKTPCAILHILGMFLKVVKKEVLNAIFDTEMMVGLVAKNTVIFQHVVKICPIFGQFA